MSLRSRQWRIRPSWLHTLTETRKQNPSGWLINKALPSVSYQENNQLWPKSMKQNAEGDNTTISISLDMLGKENSCDDLHKGGLSQETSEERRTWYYFETCVSQLLECAKKRRLPVGKKLHVDIIKSPFKPHVFMWNTLINMYAKCGIMQEAGQVFDIAHERNVVTWTTLIAGYSHQGKENIAIKIFCEMLLDGQKPNNVTFASILAGITVPAHGKYVHAIILDRGTDLDVFVGSTLVDMYARCGITEESCKVFDRLVTRDIVLWNTMMTGYVQHGNAEEVLCLFKGTQQEVKPDNVTCVCVLTACAAIAAFGMGKLVHAISLHAKSNLFVQNTLVDTYAKCGSMQDAQHVFSRILTPDTVSWNAIIGCYTCHKMANEALDLFLEMLYEGGKPDNVTFVSVLSACASLGALKTGKYVHDLILGSLCKPDIVLCNALIDMYAKCGCVGTSRLVFNQMPIRNVVTWTSIMGGYSQDADVNETLELFLQMQYENVKPDNITFTPVLSAYAHACLMDDCLFCFSSISFDYAVTPLLQHCACMVDLLSRKGQLDEAWNFINMMPFEPSVDIWVSLLDACRTHAHLELGEHSVKQILTLDPFNDAALILLSNIYAACEMLIDVEEFNVNLSGR